MLIGEMHVGSETRAQQIAYSMRYDGIFDEDLESLKQVLLTDLAYEIIGEENCSKTFL